MEPNLTALAAPTMLLDLGIRLAPVMWLGVVFVLIVDIGIAVMALRERAPRHGSSSFDLSKPLPDVRLGVRHDARRAA